MYIFCFYLCLRAASIVLPDGTDLGLVYEGSSCDLGSGRSGTCFQKECRGSSIGLPNSCSGGSVDGYCSSKGVSKLILQHM